MNVGILGSGFGLYGYLPSLLAVEGVSVLLPARYAARVAQRADIGPLAPRIDWVDTDTALLDRSDALVIAQRPQDQVAILPEILSRPHISGLLLEKPLAPTPAMAMSVLDQVEAAELRLRIGFSFRYTRWGRNLLACLESSPIDIVWQFRAHHYATGADNWKRQVSSGGGALRFYGTHLIALLAECGYDSVIASETRASRPGEAAAWTATLGGPERPACRILVDSDSDNTMFSLRSGAAGVALSDPFDEVELHPPFDRRVDVMTPLCRELCTPAAAAPTWHRAATALWTSIETANVSVLQPAAEADPEMVR